MTDDAARPIDPGEVTPAFDACFGDARRVVIAVSGGADSTALMHLATRWRDLRGQPAPEISIVTVDHGLRPESAEEARAVAGAAARLGLPHTTLVWQGPKPAAGIQAAARVARYRLLAGHARAVDCDAVVVATAHTLDDLAETVLMRLARGSGLDGLAGIEPVRSLAPGIRLARPLLQVPKARLVAMLRQRGIGWIEDPSNEQAAFERVRWRQARDTLEALGLSNAQVATSARRLARARLALEAAVESAIGAAGPDALDLDPLGYVTVEWSWLMQHPAEFRLRILSRAIEAVGGRCGPPSLGQLEAITERAGWHEPAGRTLAGVLFMPRGGRTLIVREPGRDGAGPGIDLVPGASTLWDRRFRAALAPDAPGPMHVAALGSTGLCQLESRGTPRPVQAPAMALHALPAFWHGDTVVACPPLGCFGQGIVPEHYRCTLEARLTVMPRPQS